MVPVDLTRRLSLSMSTVSAPVNDGTNRCRPCWHRYRSFWERSTAVFHSHYNFLTTRSHDLVGLPSGSAPKVSLFLQSTPSFRVRLLSEFRNRITSRIQTTESTHILTKLSAAAYQRNHVALHIRPDLPAIKNLNVRYLHHSLLRANKDDRVRETFETRDFIRK